MRSEALIRGVKNGHHHKEERMIEFYQTRMGKTFFDHTMPTIAKELARLNDLLERIAAALETKTPNQEETANAENND